MPNGKLLAVTYFPGKNCEPFITLINTMHAHILSFLPALIQFTDISRVFVSVFFVHVLVVMWLIGQSSLVIKFPLGCGIRENQIFSNIDNYFKNGEDVVMLTDSGVEP